MKQFTSPTSKTLSCVRCAAWALAAAAGITSAQAQTFSFSDSAPANPATGVNYYTASSGENAGGTGGALAISNGQFELNSNGASLEVASGSLTLTNTGFSFFVGQNASSSLDVSGGTLTINTSGATSGSGEEHVVFGNGSGDGTVTQEAGTFNIIGGLYGFYIGRQGATGSFTLSGGLLDEEDTVGTEIGSAGTLTLSGGTFEESASDAFTFDSASTSHINFSTGSSGVLSLYEASTSYLDGLVTAGDITVNGTVDTSTSDFSVNGSSTGQGTLELASAVPEPSTWALMLGGLGVLALIQRKRLSNV
jgi:hypothetical protein